MDIARPLSAIRRPRRPVSDLDDAELFRLIAGGSETAFEALWRRYGESVLGLCHAILRDPEAAEDAAQETFARVWRFAATVDPRRGEPAGWLMTVARNSALNVTRVTLPEPVPEPIERPGPAREQAMIDELWLRGALTRLSDREREVIRLAYFSDLSHTQIAARVGEPLGTVKSRIRRGLARLAELTEGR